MAANLGDLCRTLVEIQATDPSAEGHTGPDTPDVILRYAQRNNLIWLALAQAHAAGLTAGVGWDPADPRPVVVYLELPEVGQVSWHLPAHDRPWDGHTTAEKYARVDVFTGVAELVPPRDSGYSEALADETEAAADPDPDFGRDGVW